MLKVLGGDRPSKPGNAPDLGLSDDIWKMLEDCWEEKRELRPPVKHVLSRVKSAARTCGILSVVMNTSEGYTEPDPGLRLKMFGMSVLLPLGNIESTGLCRTPFL